VQNFSQSPVASFDENTGQLSGVALGLERGPRALGGVMLSGDRGPPDDESSRLLGSSLLRGPHRGGTMDQITTTLWINDGKVEEAAEFYCSLFEDSRITGSNDYGPDAGEYAGEKMAIRFEMLGRQYVAINGGATRFTPNESVSFAVGCDSQEEVDRFWAALVEGGEPGPCGWLKDRFGFSWQVTPRVLHKMLDDSDPEKVQRVTAAFMKVDGRPFDIAELEDAFEGRG
jgi:predicted 3-demethylubiquinone-9 3-methyltransferase (glyoxalase superfamily)